jgi:threonylcarbamoyladenosine tRNA methylthiotransferase MtaB
MVLSQIQAICKGRVALRTRAVDSIIKPGMGEVKRKRVALDTLGCKLNQAETELLAGQLARVGYELVGSPAKADIYVVNTCTVTHIADRKSRHLLRQARRCNPGVRLVAIGCYAEGAPQDLRKIEGVDLVLGNARKWELPQLLDGMSWSGSTPTLPLGGYGFRTRAFIKIQDGCHNFCAYCIVPLVRSHEESVPVPQIIDEIKRRAMDGCREVVLTGTEIGAYEHNGISLHGLLIRVLAETDIDRIRLSSLQPQEITPELLNLWCDSRLCPHFHLSLQSGSDAVLRRMKRRYNAADYRQAVASVREAVLDAAITTDVIVGFPGETEEEFEESHEFCRRMEFARIHVFPYSPRRGTEAAGMPGQVDNKVKRQRSQKMLALARASARNFRLRFIGRTLSVLWEKHTGGLWSGHTGNYAKVYTKSKEDLANKITLVRLEKVWRDGMWGEAD